MKQLELEGHSGCSGGCPGGVRGWLSAGFGGLLAWGNPMGLLGAGFYPGEPHIVEFNGWISRKTNLLAKKVTKLCCCIWGGGVKLLP